MAAELRAGGPATDRCRAVDDQHVALRTEAHGVLEGVAQARTDAEVSDRIAAINENIRDGIRGPEFNLIPFNLVGSSSSGNAREADPLTTTEPTSTDSARRS